MTSSFFSDAKALLHNTAGRVRAGLSFYTPEPEVQMSERESLLQDHNQQLQQGELEGQKGVSRPLEISRSLVMVFSLDYG